jgi:hypothetical protein
VLVSDDARFAPDAPSQLAVKDFLLRRLFDG